MIHGCAIQFGYRCSSSRVKCEADDVSLTWETKGPWNDHLGNKSPQGLWFQLLICVNNLWQIGLCYYPSASHSLLVQKKGLLSKKMVSRGWRIPYIIPTPLSPYQGLRKCFSKNVFGRKEGWRIPISFPLPFLRIKDFRKCFSKYVFGGKGEPLGLPRNMHFPFEITNTHVGDLENFLVYLESTLDTEKFW